MPATPGAGDGGQPGRVDGDILADLELMGGALQAEGGQHVSAPVKRGLTVSARGGRSVAKHAAEGTARFRVFGHGSWWRSALPGGGWPGMSGG